MSADESTEPESEESLHYCSDTRWRLDGRCWYCIECGKYQDKITGYNYPTLYRLSLAVDFDGAYGEPIYPSEAAEHILSLHSLTDPFSIRDFWDAYDKAQREANDTTRLSDSPRWRD